MIQKRFIEAEKSYIKEICGVSFGKDVPGESFGWISNEGNDGKGNPEHRNKKVKEDSPPQEVHCEADVGAMLAFNCLNHEVPEVAKFGDGE